jgi:hypothetical protein
MKDIVLELLNEDPIYFTALCKSKTGKQKVFVFRVLQLEECSWQIEQFDSSKNETIQRTVYCITQQDSRDGAIRQHLNEIMPHITSTFIYPLYPVLFRRYEKGMIRHDALSKLCWG